MFESIIKKYFQNGNEITADMAGRADDFINESEKDGTPANDEGRVAKLESDAKISRAFIHANTKDSATAGETIDGTTTPQACFIMSEARRLKYLVVAGKGEDVEGDFEMYNNGTSRKTGIKFNSGTYDYLTGFAFQGQREGGGAHTFLMSLYAQDGSGFPTGAAIATKSFSNTGDEVVTSSDAHQEHIFIQFDSPVSVSQATDYVLVLEETTTGGSATQNLHTYTHSTGSNFIRNEGAGWLNGISGASGSSWAAYAIYGYKNLVAGRVYKSDADDPQLNYFDGFVTQSVTSGNAVNLYAGMQLGGFSGLLAGTPYYLSTTAGAITATRGKGKRVGVARTTAILGIMEKSEYSDYQFGDMQSTSLTSPSAIVRSVADGEVNVYKTFAESQDIIVSDKFHEVMFALFTKRVYTSIYGTGNQCLSFTIKQGDIIAVDRDLSGNTYHLGTFDSRVRYIL